MSQFPTTWANMPEQAQRTLDSYLRDATKTLGSEISAMILYGSLARGDYLQDRSNINILMVFDHLTMNIMERCTKLNRRWSKERILAPLMFTRDEMNRFLETFPLEFYDIHDHHIVLAGRDPFLEIHIEGRNLLSECEREIRGNLLRVRQQFVEARGNSEGIHALLPISLTTLIPCLRGVYRLLGQSPKGTPDAILERMTANLNLDPGAFQEVWLLKRGQSTPGKHDFPNLLDRYLGALGALAERVEVLAQEGRFQGKLS
jgi:predicted nucleotidyltransferase